MGNSYKEALERARQAIGNDAYTKEDALAYAFPELGESEDERIRKELLAVINDLVLPDDQKERFNAYLEKQKGRTEWGEENEKCIKDIIICLEYLQREDAVRKWNGDRNVKPERYDDMIAKLKSLRPQSKPEWNEEDERLLNIIIDILDREEHNGHLSHDDLKNCVKLIKSFRPQPHWKPSELQMFALDSAILMFHNLKRGGDKEELEALYNDLKKLI